MLDMLLSWVAGEESTELTGLDLAFNAPLHPLLYLVYLVIACLLIFFYYRPRLTGLRRWTRAFLVALRLTIAALVFLLLLDPCITGFQVANSGHYVALLYDDSKSMQVVGRDGASRADVLKDVYSKKQEDFEDRLRKKYQVIKYGFGTDAERIHTFDGMLFSETKTDIPRAIEQAMQDLQGLDVDGVVVFSDGVQQTSDPRPQLENSWDPPVPVFTVGTHTGSEWRDVAVGNLSVQHASFDKTPVVLTADVEVSGFDEAGIAVEILRGKRVVASQILSTAEGTSTHEVRLEFTPSAKGWLEYEIRVRLADFGNTTDTQELSSLSSRTESVVQNNSKSFLIDNREKEYRILYFSGRPNWEHKFIRRALQGDRELRMTSLILVSDAEREFVFRGRRSSMNNPLFDGFSEDEVDHCYDEQVFLRLGVTESELVRGYPADADELFPFHLVIWGDAGTDSLTVPQLELTRRFVETRGGTLLVQGGPSAFADRAGNRAIIQSLFPVIVQDNSEGRESDWVDEFFHVEPSIDGRLSGAFSVDTAKENDSDVWAELPDLFGYNDFSLTRPGATTWARVRPPSRKSGDHGFFIVQRYGSGRCAMVATSDTWQLQMRADGDNPVHQQMWRQIVRSMVRDVPEPCTVHSVKDMYEAGTDVDFNALIRDSQFTAREGLMTSMKVNAPGHTETYLPVDESIQETGLYTGRFVPEEDGMHVLSVSAVDPKGEVVGAVEQAFLVEPDLSEFQNAHYDSSFLETLANLSGGRHFELEQIGDIPDSIPWVNQPTESRVTYHLWHFPPFLFFLATLMSVEWYLRRRRGQA